MLAVLNKGNTCDIEQVIIAQAYLNNSNLVGIRVKIDLNVAECLNRRDDAWKQRWQLLA